MPGDMDVTEAIELAEEIIEMIEEGEARGGGQFLEDILTKVKSIHEFMELNGRVSPKQADALESWRQAIEPR